jgi:hypothetical protein
MAARVRGRGPLDEPGHGARMALGGERRESVIP